LINSESGIVSTRNLYGNKRFEEIPSQVAAVVPHVLKSDDRNVTRADGKWSPALYLEPGDERMMGKFSQFAVAAAKEACEDAGWDGMNVTQEERERAVRFFWSTIPMISCPYTQLGFFGLFLTLCANVLYYQDGMLIDIF